MQDDEKRLAAAASLKYLEDGQVVGLGTGSTATLVIRGIAERMRAGLRIRGIPTSQRTRDLAVELGIPLTSFDDVQTIDITIDGADEIDPRLDLIKGAGGALLREKIVASASRRLVIVADSTFVRTPHRGGASSLIRPFVVQRWRSIGQPVPPCVSPPRPGPPRARRGTPRSAPRARAGMRRSSAGSAGNP